MAAKKLDKNPVFNHRNSIALVDTAEELVDSLDNLSVCLKHIEEKYVASSCVDSSFEKVGSLYEKLKQNLEVAQNLTDVLKREKWRLSRREMSMELRMGELEEYKSHLKRDMTDMNQTVDILSMRIVQLENALCEAEEKQDTTNAEKQDVENKFIEANALISELQKKEGCLQNQVDELKQQRKDAVLRQQHREMSDKMEILLIENHRLKEIIREREDSESSLPSKSFHPNVDSLKISDCDYVERERTRSAKSPQTHLLQPAGDIIDRQDSGYSGENNPTSPVAYFTETTDVEYV
ncbi:uncharacterized protein LOC127854013 [Dreissena polymorpha]|uniref:Uncharacterized protein n=1 Tax=Dreissena polymorpha TaxID=45954 RepID=A0A9D4CP88_DREPO|nr:uncharacterized protein LOC127854013 [Dreissena polymorpha]KAH3728122.1 hypothetical protein DPMN_054069 [Dreissena polymorpha]